MSEGRWLSSRFDAHLMVDDEEIPMHNTEIIRTQNGELDLWRAICSCGEKTPGFDAIRKAEEWAEQHKEYHGAPQN